MAYETARIKLTIGKLEIEYEGKESFIEKGLIDLLEKVIDFYSQHKHDMLVEWATPYSSAATSAPSASTDTIAAHLGATTGSDLVIAAAARLTFIQGKTTVTRKEILDEMKSATTYCNQNMATNLSSYINTLVKSKKLNRVSKDTFAFTKKEKENLESQLGQSF